MGFAEHWVSGWSAPGGGGRNCVFWPPVNGAQFIEPGSAGHLAGLMLVPIYFTMTDNVLVPLPNFTLPRDLPWRVKFIDAIEGHLRKLRAHGRFQPPRFFGYYFRGQDPVGVTGSWTVTLDPEPLLTELPCAVERATFGQFAIASRTEEEEPEFVLIHDCRDGACWLWRFAYGMRFVSAVEPLIGESSDYEV